MEPIDEHFRRAAALIRASPGSASTGDEVLTTRLEALFAAQAQSRHLDFAARWLQAQGAGYYTIGSAGHESNAALGLLSRVTDPALMHYRSGGFYAARAGLHPGTDPVTDVLRSLTCSVSDPISGGRHKVFGHPDLNVIPQTSTIASHLPRAMGLAFAIGLARSLTVETRWPEDAVVLCSFGDASANHSTAQGAINASAYLSHVSRPCPVLWVCEDNGLGISTRSPRGWPAAALRSLPGIPYFAADGHDAVQTLRITAEALASVRERRAPALLHLRTVRFMGHAGSDVESAYRSPRAIEADFAKDPLLGTARALVQHGGWSAEAVLSRYESVGSTVMEAARQVRDDERLADRQAVVAPIAYPAYRPGRTAPTGRGHGVEAPRLTLAQSVNRALTEEMHRHDDVLVFGEDVGAKGGVYGVTRGLQRRFGAERVFDTLLDEQSVLGTALGASLAGFVPVPEIQYLAYLHNAEDQLRGEAASLAFFSGGQYRNGMVVRVAGLAYQKGFGGHFHNDNSLAVLRDIPGIVLAVPSHPSNAPGLLRTCLDLARDDGRVCVLVEPIALYHTRDLFDGDGAWTAGEEAGSAVGFGDVALHGDGRDLLIVTFGNGVHLSRRAAATLEAQGIACTVLDLLWLTPLPMTGILDATAGARAVLVVDETRASGSVADTLIAVLVESGCQVPMGRVNSADSFVPLGPAANTVLLSESDIVAAAQRVVGRLGAATEAAAEPQPTRSTA